MEKRKVLRIVRFQDPNDDDVYWDVAFFSDLTEAELQKKAEEIVEEFEKEGYEDWTYEDIYEELKKRGLVKDPDAIDIDWCTIII